MRVLTSKYGFIVLVMFIWMAISFKNTNNNECHSDKSKKIEGSENKIIKNVASIVYNSSNSAVYQKYLSQISNTLMPSRYNPIIVEEKSRNFLSLGQKFVSCGSEILITMEIKNKDNDVIFTSNIPLIIGDPENPQELDNIVKGMTISDSKTFISDLSDYPKSFKNYKDYKEDQQYTMKVTIVSLTNGTSNNSPFYFVKKTDQKTTIPLCNDDIKIKYVIQDLITSNTIIQFEEKMSYSTFSKIATHYPLLAMGINNLSEIVVSKSSLLKIIDSTPIYKKISESVSSYNDNDAFVLSQTIVEHDTKFNPGIQIQDIKSTSEKTLQQN